MTKQNLNTDNNNLEKELACWIYYEDGSVFYCFDCVEKRIEEINKNKEFSDDIDYEDGDTCGYFQDYADTEGEYEFECCKCNKPLFTTQFVLTTFNNYMTHKIIFDQPLEIDFTFIEGNSDGSTSDEIEIENLEDIECAIVSYLHKIRCKVNKYKEED